MLARRRAIACALCAAIGLAATGADAQPAGGLTRTVLQRTEHPGDKHVTLLVRVEVEPGAFVARHTHPGTESGYIVEGESTFSLEGQPDRVVKPGDSYLVPPGAPHAVRNGPTRAVIIATFVVEKDKPLASPA